MAVPSLYAEENVPEHIYTRFKNEKFKLSFSPPHSSNLLKRTFPHRDSDNIILSVSLLDWFGI